MQQADPAAVLFLISQLIQQIGALQAEVERLRAAAEPDDPPRT